MAAGMLAGLEWPGWGISMVGEREKRQVAKNARKQTIMVRLLRHILPSWQYVAQHLSLVSTVILLFPDTLNIPIPSTILMHFTLISMPTTMQMK